MGHDLNTFIAWLSQTVPAEPQVGVVAYNLNIAETIDGFEIELVGSSYFDPNNTDWACEEIWTSRPSKYVAPYLEAGKDWEQFLTWVARAFSEYMSIETLSMNTIKQAEAVTVGFVDGELLILSGGGAAKFFI